MALSDFLAKHRTNGTDMVAMLKDGLSDLGQRVNNDRRHRPTHIPTQERYITEAFDTDEPVWLFFFDAGRYDIFDQLVWDYFDGDLERVWNGGNGYTGDWTVQHLTQDFGHRGLFSWIPLRGFQDADYDGRRYFSVAPDIMEQADRQEQLAALGYAESSTERTFEVSPQHVNAAVRDHAEELNGGVIRYLKPHPPFSGLEEMTSESTKTLETRQALDSGRLTYAELTEAYRETYKVAFEHAARLIPDLNGRVIITADHGTCLTCGQLFHGRRHAKHDHLCVVPWFELDYIT